MYQLQQMHFKLIHNLIDLVWTSIDKTQPWLYHIPWAKGRGSGVGVLYKSSPKLISVKQIHHADFKAMNITLKQSIIMC